MHKFISLIKSSQGESLARQLSARDIDRDGILSIDGFKAAILVHEYGVSNHEAEEIFRFVGGATG
jgi:hypothetical protein